MDNLQITTGQKRLSIDRDGVSVGELVFNPNDVVFVERFYQTYGKLKDIEVEYKERINSAEKNKAVDENGVRENFPELLEIWKAIHASIQTEIDNVFGVGTSLMVFGNYMTFDSVMYEQFFDGITPHIQAVRADKIGKYMIAKPQKISHELFEAKKKGKLRTRKTK